MLAQLVAEVEFNSAQKLADAYLWQKAEVKFKKSLASDPFNALHFAGYADFLRSTAPYRENEVVLLQKAEILYGRACELDPMRAGYFLGSGAIKLKLHKFNEGLADLKRALEKDPNGFNTAYEVGYRAIQAWQYLDDGFKALVIDRLRYALVQKRWYWEHVYPIAWQSTNDFTVLEQIAPDNVKAKKDLLYFVESNNLYQFRKRVVDALNSVELKEDPQGFEREQKEKIKNIEEIKKNTRGADVVTGDLWQGKSVGGKEYKDGNMYWSGTMYGVLNAASGGAKLVIQAKGSPADNIYPYMIVGLEGKEIGEAFVNNDDWIEYSFLIKAGAGKKVLSVTFCNDGGNVEKNEDRNLYIGEAKIE